MAVLRYVWFPENTGAPRAAGGTNGTAALDGGLQDLCPSFTGLSVEEWRSGGVEEWRSGGVEEWRSGGVEEWRSGGVEEWRSGGVEEWRSGGVEEWRSGGVEEWRSGGVKERCVCCRAQTRDCTT
ncbi:uncharacterized protein LOC134532323 [Bacillus rossius redtenbacheri]|uniref:uncharacterized protein LOC134532323 n=1 Tax=Bacillus rossius redtenbacheri TaxID=93214 RepID=UPI002FDCB48A